MMFACVSCICSLSSFEFFFDCVYVDLQYDEISLTLTAGSVVLGSSLVCMRVCRGTLCG